MTIGKTYGTLPTPNRTGYSFDGWYTKEIGGTKVTETTTVGTNPPTKLYAHWIAKKYLVPLMPTAAGSTRQADKSKRKMTQ